MVAAAILAVLVASVIALIMQGSAGHAASGSATPDGVAITVQSFGQALRSHDFKAICDDLFTPDARAAAGGSDCATTLGASGNLLQHPRVRLNSVLVHGHSAIANVSVQQDHRQVMTEVLSLTSDHGHFRISAVASPGE